MEPVISTANASEAEEILKLQVLCYQSEAALYSVHARPLPRQKLLHLLNCEAARL